MLRYTETSLLSSISQQPPAVSAIRSTPKNSKWCGLRWYFMKGATASATAVQRLFSFVSTYKQYESALAMTIFSSSNSIAVTHPRIFLL